MSVPSKSISMLARFTIPADDIAVINRSLQEVSDWSRWLADVEMHGLSGIVNLHQKAFDLALPAATKLSLKALGLRHAAAAKARHKALAKLDAVFAELGVEYLGLKGVALVPRLYKDAVLRPMRDMDLLVPKSKLNEAKHALRQSGFELPDDQPSKFMRFTHQLPNATIEVDGFTCSVEIHHNANSNELAKKLAYPENSEALQTLKITEDQEIDLPAFDDCLMLHQVSKHLEGQHPGAVLKLINVMDVVGLALEINRSGRWAELVKQYPHVLCTLQCIHLLAPLPDELLAKIEMPNSVVIDNVGEIMPALSSIMQLKKSWPERLEMLFLPSDWWLHLHYNVEPSKSLFFTKLVRHPLSLFNSMIARSISALLGG